MPDLPSALELKTRLGQNFKKIITLKGEVIGAWSIQSYGDQKNLPVYVRRLQEFSVVRERDLLERRLIELEKEKEAPEVLGLEGRIREIEIMLENKKDEGRLVSGELEMLRSEFTVLDKEMELIENKVKFCKIKMKEIKEQISTCF